MAKRKKKKERRPAEDELLECRQLHELRLEGEGEQRRIVGYAAVFDTLSDDLGGFREEIAPGAFDPLDQDVRCTFNHDANQVVGRTSSGTLELKTDKRGLWFSARPPATTWARDLLASIERGDVNQGSFMFRVRPGGEEWRDDDGATIRRLTAVRTRDVAVVTYPAYPDTRVAARSLQQRSSAVDPHQVGGESSRIPTKPVGNTDRSAAEGAAGAGEATRTPPEHLNAAHQSRQNRADDWTGPEGWTD